MATKLWDLSGDDEATDKSVEDIARHFGEQISAEWTFPAMMQHRLLGRRLRRLVQDIAGEGDEAAVNTFLEAINPVGQGDHTADGEAHRENWDGVRVCGRFSALCRELFFDIGPFLRFGRTAWLSARAGGGR